MTGKKKYIIERPIPNSMAIVGESQRVVGRKATAKIGP